MRFAAGIYPPMPSAISPQAADVWATNVAADARNGRLPYAPRERGSLAGISAELHSPVDLRASRFAAEDARDLVFAEQDDLLSYSRMRACRAMRYGVVTR